MSDFYFHNNDEYVESIIDAIAEIEKIHQDEAILLIEQSKELISNGFRLKISAENMAAHILGIKNCTLS